MQEAVAVCFGVPEGVNVLKLVDFLTFKVLSVFNVDALHIAIRVKADCRVCSKLFKPISNLLCQGRIQNIESACLLVRRQLVGVGCDGVSRYRATLVRFEGKFFGIAYCIFVVGVESIVGGISAFDKDVFAIFLFNVLFTLYVISVRFFVVPVTFGNARCLFVVNISRVRAVVLDIVSVKVNVVAVLVLVVISAVVGCKVFKQVGKGYTFRAITCAFYLV